MKRFAFCILLLALAGASLLIAQQSLKSADQPSQPNFVFDDDGGAVQIVPVNMAATAPEKFHGGAVMKSVQQVSIFLGSGWGDPSMRSRESTLLDLLSNGSSQVALQKHNIASLPAGATQEDFTSFDKTINDLNLQHKLADMLHSKAIPAPSASTVYVVFLAPGVNSVIGPHQAGKDYAAYHNFFNLQAGQVRYVVVPFDSNAANEQSAAARALTETALNPTGNGWY
jgi:hypothetical protein